VVMANLDETLSDFIDAWNAGQRPDLDEYLERLPESEREELAALIRAFMVEAPVPAYSVETLREIQSEPAVRRTIALIESQAGLWAELLPRLRSRVRLTREQVVSRLAEALGQGPREASVHAYYHRMESGTIEPAGVSRRVLDALAGIFGVPTSDLEAAGDFGSAPGPGTAYTMFTRTLGVDAALDMNAERLEYRSPEKPPEKWDDVDRLFLGGR
jgi:hypothetical protein